MAQGHLAKVPLVTDLEPLGRCVAIALRERFTVAVKLRNQAVGFLLGLVALPCAGQELARQPDESLVLGQTTAQEIEQRLGSPSRTAETVRDGKRVVTRIYIFSVSPSSWGAVALDVTPWRTQSFHFFEDRLVGHDFVSSWKSDNTDFDAANVPKIQKGTSSRADVAKLMGPPHGRLMYPMLAGPEDQGDVYLYTQRAGWALSWRLYRKSLIVRYDKHAIVSEVTYTESGER